MSSVDNRVVNMQFNNAQFEKGISTTLASLDKLKKGLNLDESTKSLSNLEKTANNFSMANLGDAVQSIANRFSNLGVVGMSALHNLTTKAMEVGSKLTSAITGPIIEGGKTRAKNIEQAKFQIRGLLGEKKYAKDWVKIEEDINYGVQDTAYGFDSAAKAASQFMASGVKVGKEMKGALRGVSGVAAMTNSSYEDISRIFTTISGNGKIMGEQFNQFAARGLNVAAVLAKQLNMTEAEVRDVKNNPIDFKTFAAAMDKAYGEHAKKANETYDGALSNMKASLARIGAEIAGPTFDNLRDVFNSLTPVFNNAKQALLPFIEVINKRFKTATDNAVKFLSQFGQKLDKNGNKVPKKAAKTLISIIQNITKGFQNIAGFVKTVITPIKQAFNEMFPPKTAQDVKNFTETFKELTSRLSLTEKNSENLRRTFKGVFAVFSIVKTIAGQIISVFGNLWKNTSNVRGGFLQFTASIGDFLVKIDGAIKESKLLKTIFDALQNAFSAIGGVIYAAGNRIKMGFDAIQNGFKGVKGGPLEKFINLLSSVASAIRDFAEAIADRLLGDDMNKSSETLNKLANAGILVAFIALKKNISNGAGLIDALMAPINKIATSFDSVLNSINDLFDNLSESIKSFNKKLKSEVLLNVAKGIALLAASLFILSTIDSDALYSSVTVMGVLFAELALFMKSFNKSIGGSKSILDTPGLLAASEAMVSLGISMIMLASSLKMLSGLSWDQLAVGITGITALLSVLVGVVKALSGDKAKKMNKGLVGLIAMAAAIRIMTKALVRLSELEWEDLGKAGASITVLMGSMAGFIKIISGSRKIISASIGMVILASAMEILTDVCLRFSKMSWEDLGKAGAAVTVLLGSLGGFSILISKLTSGGKLMVASIGMVILASAMEILTDVCQRFSKMSWEDLGKAGAAITVLLGSLGGFATFISKLTSGGKLMVASIGMVILASAMETFANVANKFASISWDGLAKAGTAITVLLAAIMAFSNLVNGKDLFVQSIALITFGLAIKDLTTSLDIIAKINVLDIAKALIAIAIMLELIYNFAEKTKDMKNVTIAITAILALAFAVKLLSNIGWVGLITSVGGLAATFIIMGVGAKLLKPLIPTLYRLSGTMLVFSASMLTMGLSTLSFGAGLLMIGAGFTSIATAGGAIADVLVPLADAIKTAAPNIVGALFAVLESVLINLEEFAPKLFHTIYIILVGALNTLTKLIPKITEFIGHFIKDIAPILTKQLPTLVNLVFDFISKVLDVLIERAPEIVVKVIKLFAVIFSSIADAMGDIKPETFIAAVAAFGILIGLFAAMSAASKLIKGALKTGLAMIVVFGALTAMFLILNTIDAGSILTMALSLSGALVAITACMVVASMIPVAAAAQGIAGLAIVIAGLTAIIAALGALKQIPGLQWLVDEGAEMLKSIGSAIGGFFGSIVGGFLEGMSEGLVGIADNLSEFMIRLTPFIAGAKMLNADSMNGVKALAETILILTAAELLDGLAGWLTGGSSIKDFADDMVALAPALVKYGKIVSGMDGKAVKASASAGLTLANFANNLPKTGGVVQWFTGETVTLSTFADELVKFGPKLMKYSESIKGLDVKAVKASASAGKVLAGLADNLPKHGGAAQWFGGDATLSGFGKELEVFGPAIVNYANTVKDIKAKSVEGSVAAGKALSGLAKDLPSHGGIVEWFTGGATLGTFGKELLKFAPAIVKYSDKVKDVNPAAVTASAISAKSLTELAKNLPTSGGLAKFFGGSQSFTDFGNNLAEFGKAFKGYYNNVKDINNVNLTGVVNNAFRMLSFLKAIKDNNYEGANVADFKDGINAIASANIDGFTKAFKSFNNPEELHSVGKSIMLNIANGCLASSDTLSNSAEEASKKLIDYLKSGLKSQRNSYKTALEWYTVQNKTFSSDSGTSFKSIGKTLITKWINGLNSKHDAFKSAMNWYSTELATFKNNQGGKLQSLGTTLIAKLNSGLSSKHDSFKTALSWYTNKMDSIKTEQIPKWKTLGTNSVDGLTKGIKAKKGEPVTALGEIASNMLKVVRKKLKIASPSKALYKYGMYSDKGLAGGLDHYAYMIANSSGGIADTILNTLKSPLTTMSDYLGSDFDYDPVIRPVLDLSDIQNGSNFINGLFDDPRVRLSGLGIDSAKISGNIGLRDDSNLYNDSNVLTAIGQLRSEVSELSKTMKNLKIVMDTGATVGALAPGIDRTLGEQASYKERWI